MRRAVSFVVALVVAYGWTMVTPSARAANQQGAPTNPAAAQPSQPAAQAYDQAALLRRMIDLDRLTTPPGGERSGMCTSFDRKSKLDPATGKYIDWEANADWGQFIRTTEDGWDVMAEMSGPGAITRIWSANPVGTIRIVLDGRVAIEAPFADLFNGKLAPFADPLCYANPHNGGKNCYFPIGYAQSCQVLIRESKSYYQVNYVTFAAGETVATFAPQLDEAATAALAEVVKAWTEGLEPRRMLKSAAPPLPTANAIDLERRSKQVFEEVKDGGTIRALRVALTDKANPRDLYALHKCILRIFFDGEKEPAVEAPLVDFFGSGFDLRPFVSLPVGSAGPTDMPMPGRRASDQSFMYCYFPMPFSDGFKIEIENLGERKIGLMVQTLVDRDVPKIRDPAQPPRERLRFHARFRKIDPCEVFDFPILEASGRGRIVGVVLNVDCPRATWWGEGDDKVWIDGEAFPSYFGTGSEDYLGDAWGLREHIRAQQGVTLKNDFGKNSSYRWHIFDCINFEKSVRFTIENWQFGGFKDTYYSTVAYWYADPASKAKFEPLKLADVTPPGLRIPDSVEIEGRVKGENTSNPVKEKYARGSELSGQAAVRITVTDPVKISLPTDKERSVALSLRVDPKQPFETIAVTAPDGLPLRTVEYKRESGGTYELGVTRLTEGDNLFTVQCAKPATLDCWIARTVEVRSPHAVEAEQLTVLGSDKANATVQGLSKPALSGGAQLWCRPTEAGAWIELALPARKPGKYKLSVVYTTSHDYGMVQTYVNGAKAGQPFDTLGELASGPIRELGTFDVGAEPLKIKCELTGKAEKSPGYYFGVDCFILEPAE